MLSARLWRYGPFLRFFVGSSLSNIGNWFNTIAVAVLVYQLTGRVSGVAVTIAVSALPRILLAPLGGALADRFERRNLLCVLDAVRAVVALLPLLAHDARSVGLVYLAVLVLQAGACIYSPAQNAYVPRLVPDDLLEEANAAYAAMKDIAMFAGPTLAWIILRSWGPALAFWCNGLSFAISAGLLLTLPRTGRGVSCPLALGRLIAGYLGIVRDYPRIAPLYVCNLFCTIPVFFFQTIMVVYAKELGQTTAFVGVLYGFAGLGGVAGALFASHYLRRLPYAAILGVYALYIPLLGSLSLVTHVVPALVLLALSTSAGTVGDLVFTVSVQRVVAVEERGRAFGLLFWCLPIGQIVGAGLGSKVTAQTSVPMLLWVCAGVLPVILIGLLLSARARQLPGRVPHGAMAKSLR